jgi:hypothetical protein
MTLETQITVLISLAVAALLTVTAKYLIDIIQTLKKNVKTTNLGWMIEMTIEAGCLLAEKMFKSGEGQKKLAFVLNYVKSEAQRLGINIDMVEVTNLINKFVDEVINEGKKKDGTQPTK